MTKTFFAKDVQNRPPTFAKKRRKGTTYFLYYQIFK